MIADIISKIADNSPLTIEERAELVDWFTRAQTTPDILKGAAVLQSLDQITHNLGDMYAGRFIAPSSTATSLEPTETGFTGSFVAGDALTFGSSSYHVGGVNAGVLQWGANSSDGKLYAGAGNVLVDSSGILISSGGSNKVHIQSDGDVFIGSNIAAASTTSFSVFVNAQTYNTESMGAGDILIGDNSSGKPNIFYDKSATQLQFRSGTAVEVYVDTDGKIYAGGGNVIIGSNGIRMANSASSWFNFADDGGAFGNINIAVDPNNDFEFVNLATTPAGTFSFFLKDTGGTTRRFMRLLEDPANSNIMQMDLSPNANGSKFSMGGEVVIWAQVDSKETVFNDGSYDIDHRFEGATDTHLVYMDAGNDNITIGGTSATGHKLAVDGVLKIRDASDLTSTQISNVAGTDIVFNETGADINFRIEGDTDTALFNLDAGLDTVGIGGIAGSGIKLGVFGKTVLYNTSSTQTHVLETATSGTVVFNNATVDIDFRVAGDTDGNLLFVDAGNDRVGIGTSVPGTKLDVVGTITSDGLSVEGDATISGEATFSTFLTFGTSTLTIATGAVTATKSYHSIDTESAAATDDLDTINGAAARRILILQPASGARTVVVKNGTGNITLAGSDFSMDNASDRIVLLGTASGWVELARANNGA